MDNPLSALLPPTVSNFATSSKTRSRSLSMFRLLVGWMLFALDLVTC